MSEETPRSLFGFAGADSANGWLAVNDGVMGGVSEGGFRITDRKTLEFSGRLSLENNGGFASVRSRARKLGLESGEALLVRVRGDGRAYSLNLYLDKKQVAFSYRVALQSRKDEWIEVRLPLAEFRATSFGRVVADAGPVNPDEVNALGFMLADKNPGPFRLEVEWIKVLRSGALDRTTTRPQSGF